MYTQKKLSETLRSFGNKIAIEEGGIHVSYADISARADKVAGFLLNDQCEPGSRIGIYTTRITDLVTIMLGVIGARCVFVPLDTSLPEKRLSWILQEANPAIIISAGDEQVPVANETNLKVVGLSDVLTGDYPSTSDALSYQENDSLYIYFTSGSTGAPKGIIGKNSSLWHFIEWEIRTFKIGQGLRFSQLISPYFDAFLRDIFVPLMTGGTVCVPSRKEGIFTPEKLTLWLEDHKIQIIHCVPSVFRLFNNKVITIENLKDLKYVLLSGERIIPSELLHWYKTFSTRIQLVNLYGATEATMISSYHIIEPSEAQGEKIPIGKPIDDVTLVVLDEEKALCETLTEGDLYIVSDYLSKGYLNNAQLTAENFIMISLEGTLKLSYKTGDRAIGLADGSVDLRGRQDRQIKLRGIRVELDEIERAMLTYAGVTNAIVQYSERIDGLLAFVTGDRGDQDLEIWTSKISKHIAELLPAYMLPSRVVHTSDFPLLSNGKVDYRKLMEAETLSGEKVIRPANIIEEKIHAIWKDVLNADFISIDEKFHAAGGNSLSIMRLIPRFFAAFGIRVTLADLFQNLTIEKQASLMEGKISPGLARTMEVDTGDSSSSDIPRVQQQDYYALSSSQERLFFLSELEDDSLAYNMPHVVRLDGHLDKTKLNYAIKQLVERHESLRTAIVIVDDRPVLKIERDIPFSIDFWESSEEQCSSIIREFIRPFDLEEAPLFRVGLITLSADLHLLMMDMHHCMADGSSHEVMARDFMRLYNGDTLKPLRLQYKDYAAWQQSAAHRDRIHAQQEFWKQEFSGELSTLNIAYDFPRPQVKTDEGGNKSFCIDKTSTTRLKQIADASDATVFMTILSMFNVLLSKLSNQEDITIGTVTAGRYHRDLDEIVGMFVNTVPLRNFPLAELSFRDFLLQVKARALASFENQSYPYEQLIGDLNLARDTSRNPLFDVMFIFQNYEQQVLDIPGMKLVPREFDHRIAKFDLTLMAEEREGELLLDIEYSAGLFREETIERFVSYFQNIVVAVMANPDIILENIDILPARERQRVVQEFNATEVAYDPKITIVDLIERQVEATPEAVALIFGKEWLSYRDFDRKANALAATLEGKGIRNGDVVGIMYSRSFELMIAIYGVLKAGAAYLPIDPMIPKQRIDYMLENSEAKLLLAEMQFQEVFRSAIPVVNLATVTEEAHDVRFKSLSRADDVAYIIYTSGSTGRPKGVMVPHRALSNLSCGIEKFYSFGNKTILSVTTFSFDIFIAEAFLPLQQGATVVIASELEQRDPAALNAVMIQHRVDIIQTTPSLMRAIVESEQALPGLKRLTHVLIAGEPFPATLVRELKNRTSARIFNLYGPTETTVYSAIEELTDERTITIGRPLANTQVYVVNNAGQIQPLGIYGELWISGDGVSCGYKNRPQLTAEKFIINPFDTGKQLYKTGDKARWTTDGKLELLGRMDDQVKIRGFRIELREIENVLKNNAEIQDAIVTVKEKNGEQYLIGYYVARGEIAVSKVQQWLAEYLPQYMIPHVLVQIDAMPFTTSGKRDRLALPEPVLAQTDEQRKPSNEVEKKLQEIWSSVLNMEEQYIGVHRNFFDLGGNSLKLITLANKLRRTFNTNVPVAALFNAPTISSLAIMLGDKYDTPAGLDLEIADEMEIRDETLNLMERE